MITVCQHYWDHCAERRDLARNTLEPHFFFSSTSAIRNYFSYPIHEMAGNFNRYHYCLQRKALKHDECRSSTKRCLNSPEIKPRILLHSAMICPHMAAPARDHECHKCLKCREISFFSRASRWPRAELAGTTGIFHAIQYKKAGRTGTSGLQ